MGEKLYGQMDKLIFFLSFLSAIEEKIVEVFRSEKVDDFKVSYSVRITPQVLSLSMSISTLSIVVY